ncbi:hypothetical protein BJY01DRAFT_239054 [Aspergillus pseudoustus]|uniref:FAD-binding domain-containing protein n=1 Tax=Aspergillus pseudoustus TaxID=1810923 RepID=A0ABR4J3Y6_9EURO
MEDPKTSGLRVIIIGGAITGLTLAHCLDKADIDYVVLEKHQDIRANIGGSIGLQPNGLRILDQVGVYDHLKKWRNDTDVMKPILPDGFCLGYPMTMVRRAGVLDALYTSLKDQSKIKLGAKVVSINRSLAPDGRLRVDTEDGQHYTGDVVVGADGVHGIARAQMWRMMDQKKPGMITDQERESMTVDYIGIFGITEPIESITDSLNPTEMYVPSYPKANWFVQAHVDNTVTWCLNLRLDKTYLLREFHRWSPEQVSEKMKDFLEYDIWGSIKFRHLWERTTTVSAAPLYEGLMTTWTFGGIACIGDSVFKLTTVTGKGANISIESAAALANTLHQLSVRERKPSNAEIQAALAESVEGVQRKLRTVSAVSYRATRVCTLESVQEWFFFRYLCPMTWRILFSVTFNEFRTAETLSYLPLPHRAIRAAERLGNAQRRKKMMIGLGALIGLGVCYYCFPL